MGVRLQKHRCQGHGCHSHHCKAADHKHISVCACHDSADATAVTESRQDSCCSSDSADSPEPDPEPESSDSLLYTHRWSISGIDCPSCIKKVEDALIRLPHVRQAHLSFSTMRLQVSFDKEAVNPCEAVKNCVEQLGYSLSSPHRIPTHGPEPAFWQKYATVLILLVLMIVGGLLAVFPPAIFPGASTAVFVFATLWGGYPVVRKAIAQACNGTLFGIETLMGVAALGALGLGESLESAMVLWLFLIGEQLEGLAAQRARKGVESLMALTPDHSLKITVAADGREQRERVQAQSLRPGDVIEVLHGDRLPVDGELVSGAASFDESALTGESIPVEHEAGDRVMAGSLCAGRVARFCVVSKPGDNAIDRIIRLIEQAEESRAPIERFIDRFSRWYTPLMLVLAALVMIIPPVLFDQAWSVWIYRSLALLLIACPCALVISTPAAVTSGLARAARQGMLIKGGAVLERLASVGQIAFDKTGTLTEGRPQVVDVLALGKSHDQLIRLAAAVESGSRHPLAQAIVHYARQHNLKQANALHIAEQVGFGVRGIVDGQSVVVGSPRALEGEHSSAVDESVDGRINHWQSQGCTVVSVLCDQQLAGLIALQDTLRPNAASAVAALKGLGVTPIMLTGDNQRVAAALAQSLRIDYHAELLPEDKQRQVVALQAEGAVAMVGDGINDAPALKSADVGIAMGGGTDVALETADGALIHGRIEDLPKMIALSRATLAIIQQNVAFAIGLKALFLLTTIFGMTGLLIAIMADTGATVLVTMNALRLLRHNTKY